MIPRTLRMSSSSRGVSLPRVDGTPPRRLAAVARQMASSTGSASSSQASSLPGVSQNELAEAPVLFASELNARTYILNRPKQLNVLDLPTITLLKHKIEEWESSPRCHVIIGTGQGRAFCAGGDVKKIVQGLERGDATAGVTFFKEEFELDYALAKLKTPYVAILDGITMGGGVGLSINARFRVATENTVFGMPETKIGYSPDVGASHFLPRLDGALGRYLGLTGDSLYGREVFEAGIATHYVSSHRLPQLLERLSSLESPTPELIDHTLEEFYSEKLPNERPSNIMGRKRMAIDSAFSADTVEGIVQNLENLVEAQIDTEVTAWARQTLDGLLSRSPTSLRITLELLGRGQRANLAKALTTEFGIATAFCAGASRDFVTGVTAVVIDKTKSKPKWQPETLAEVSREYVVSRFFAPSSTFLQNRTTTTFGTQTASDAVESGEAPKFSTTGVASSDQRKTATSDVDPMRYSLPSEEEIGQLVRGEHPTSSDSSLNLEELLERVRGYHKHGVEEKVKDVVFRRCEQVPATEARQAHLRWIH